MSDANLEPPRLLLPPLPLLLPSRLRHVDQGSE